MTAVLTLNKSSSSAWLLSCKGGKRSAAVLAAIKAKKAAFSLPRVLAVKQPTWWSFVSKQPPTEVTILNTPQQPKREVTPLTFEQRMCQLVLNGEASLVLTDDGCGGVYMIQQNGKSIAVFKPRDEEYMAPENPRGYRCPSAVVGQSPHPAKKGFLIGDGAVREVAAYLMDSAYKNFSGVPTTELTSLPINGVFKEGSIQDYVQSESSAEDIGTLRFGVTDVHKIAILDIRLFNTDRHAGNILLQQSEDKSSTYNMVPIDHGLCLPSVHHLDAACFEWLYWPQAKFPLSAEAVKLISSLDVDHDAKILRSIGVAEESIVTMRLSTRLMQKGVEAGFSLYDIGSMLQREGDGLKMSKIEELVENCKTVEVDVTSHAFLLAAEEALDELWNEADKCKGRSMSEL